jgi:pyruvate/2-oxoglutarate dehydrogenase complex dihydrolipoamide dehydrogenase (E3) component
MTSTNYDVIVVGTSQGGRFLPIAFAKAGRKVALIERDQMGGVCVNVGCTPTKTMVAILAPFRSICKLYANANKG